MNIIVKNRLEILGGYHPGGAAILISISDVGDVRPECDSAYVGVLNLFFDDVDVETDTSKVINSMDARNILRFVEDNLPTVETVVVHCNAGVSRSAGCAAALSLIYNGDDRPITTTKPTYNRKVYREVVNEHFFY